MVNLWATIFRLFILLSTIFKYGDKMWLVIGSALAPTKFEKNPAIYYEISRKLSVFLRNNPLDV